jgi:hypothetical protein
MTPNSLNHGGVAPHRRRGVWLWVTLVLGLAFLVERATFAIAAMGRNLIQPAIERDYLVGLATAVLIAASILLWPIRHEDKKHVLRLWGVKCVVVLGLMLPYEWHYGLDAQGYFYISRFDDPPFMHGIEKPGFGTGTGNLFYLAWLLGHVIPDSYHGQKTVFAAVGLVGIYFVYRAACLLMAKDDARILYFLALFPSCLFWSSILGKDPVVLLGMGMYAYGVVGFVKRRSMLSAMLIISGVLVAMWIRLWMGPIMLLALVAPALRASRRLSIRIAVPSILVVGLAFSFAPLAERFRIETAEDLLARIDRFSQAGGWEGGSYIGQPEDLSTVAGIVRFAPAAAFTALFRPLPGEVPNIFGILASLENVVLMGFIISILFRRREGALREPLVLWAAVLSLVWAVAYGMTIFNLGTMVRMKLQVLPIMLTALLYVGGFGVLRRTQASSQPSDA